MREVGWPGEGCEVRRERGCGGGSLALWWEGGQRSCDDSERNGFAPGADGTSLSRVLDRAGRDSAVSE